jgi:aminocarboxymuconate-semialdehyde decarboxylase
MAEIWNKYADTVARKHGSPGRAVRPRATTIDIHAHAVIPAVAQYMRPYVDPTKNALARYASEDTRAINTRQLVDIHSRISGTDERFSDMDRMGVDMQMVMPPLGQLYHDAPVERAVVAARMINDGLAELAAKHSDRLIPCGTVPMQDSTESISELERCATRLGFRSVEILTNVAGRELSDPVFTPFWKKAEEPSVLVVIHPNGFTDAARLSRFSFNNVIGNPLDTTLALHYLIFDGVFERHPQLKVLAVHGGGFFGAYFGRADHSWGARSDARGNLPNPPTSYLKRVYFDTIVFNPLQLKTLVEAFGVEHIVMGTDYPFDMLENDPIDHIASVPQFDETTRSALAGGNAKALLGL